ncbi:ARM REPEAT PROTEIN INTERACTING WITH ABF2 [Tetrabaena socialis]|uniref:ARM REPEAT PROTEIN INTERACTING WITH ABF2 n=1 Tax=Tetrabaena socialis TaxID=47790 RepID=A0A2J8ADY3_9CHLO|nr:ARM REPEAT PROTEIN INTERACTING WITH ABF2 [Tetrabaena socialis]|eukprot:PNH10719.1 ARM REPEAT PROTEIN INTERACTING WITH ABF2 [Tetrabaena socialis]
MQLFHCKIYAENVSYGAVTRVLPGARPGEAASVQTLVACGPTLWPLRGADALGGLELGPPLQLYAEAAARDCEPAAARRPYIPSCPFVDPVWNSSCSAVYMLEGNAVVRLSSDGTVTVVAGDVDGEGDTDGPGRAARFAKPEFLTSDGAGSLYVADGGRIRLMQLPGAEPGAGADRAGAPPGGRAEGAAVVDGETLVSTLPHRAPSKIWGLAFDGGSSSPAILPIGCLALVRYGDHSLHVLVLGLKLPARHAAAAGQPPAAPAPLPRTLPADLGALLDRQPDGTADVTIVVGGRTFHAHRVLLSARSDYFKQRLGGGFVDSSAQQLSLPDADPDAFELWLRFIYTGAADIPTAKAAGVAELADRLLLPELREQATAVVEASVSAGTVAGLLLWADARGLAELLSRLKA